MAGPLGVLTALHGVAWAAGLVAAGETHWDACIYGIALVRQKQSWELGHPGHSVFTEPIGTVLRFQ